MSLQREMIVQATNFKKNTECAKVVLLQLDTVRDSLQRNPTSKHSKGDW